MPFKISRGVRKRTGNEFDNYRRTFVGYHTANQINYTVGRFGFNNPISATMFSHLNQQADIPTQYAKEAIQRFEEKLRKIGKLQRMINHTKFIDVASGLVSHPLKKLIDIPAKAADCAGGLYVGMVAKHGDSALNWYPPTDSNGAKNYATVALGYWHKHPKNGPAYILGRKAAGKHRSTAGTFNPFGW